MPGHGDAERSASRTPIPVRLCRRTTGR